MSQLIMVAFICYVIFSTKSFILCNSIICHVCAKSPYLIIYSCKSERVNSCVITYSKESETHVHCVKACAYELAMVLPAM